MAIDSPSRHNEATAGVSLTSDELRMLLDKTPFSTAHGMVLGLKLAGALHEIWSDDAVTAAKALVEERLRRERGYDAAS